MNVAELVTAVSGKIKLSQAATRRVVKSTLDTIRLEVKRGNRVSLVGFGAFFQAPRKARNARNPRTGAVVKVAATTVPRFKAGKEFRTAVGKTKKKK